MLPFLHGKRAIPTFAMPPRLSQHVIGKVRGANITLCFLPVRPDVPIIRNHNPYPLFC